jgi:two-component system, OmpR family, sensor histidine kinase BaeS
VPSPYGPFPPTARRVAFLIGLVALVSLGLLAAVTLVFANNDVATLSSRQKADLGNAVARAAGVSYAQHEEWSASDLSPILALASQTGFAVKVQNASGDVVDDVVPEGVHSNSLGTPLVIPIRDQGTQVGTVSVQTSTTGIGADDDSLRRALVAAVGGSVLVLAILAVVAGIVFARRITEPVVALTRAARAMAAGDKAIRVQDVGGPREMADLSRSFNSLADALEREDELRRMLVADIAHELRTPLAILQASTEAMADGVTEPTDMALSSLHEETIRLGRIVADLEVLASAQAATLTLHIEQVDLAVVARRAAAALAPQFEAAGLRLTLELQPAVVSGDRDRLHQIVTNLLTNAIKFTPPSGWVTLSVDAGDGIGRLRVEDSGRGIPKNDLEHVFDRFWRGPGVRQTSGSGIGLAVVQELVAAHRGTITAASGEGRGASFFMTVPIRS